MKTIKIGYFKQPARPKGFYDRFTTNLKKEEVDKFLQEQREYDEKENIGCVDCIPDQSSHDERTEFQKYWNIIKNTRRHRNLSNKLYKGTSKCRICGCDNGNSEMIIWNKSTVYCIPEGYYHYIISHRIKPDLENLRKVAECLSN